MECSNCAGTGTTVIAVIALILIIIAIIVFAILYFFPSAQSFIEVRGVNFDLINGIATGSTSSTNSDSLPTGINNLYLSQALIGDINLTILSNTRNFVGLTIGIKNTTSDTSTGNINLINGAGVTLLPGGLTNGTIVAPGQFAWFVLSSIGSTQTFTRLS